MISTKQFCTGQDLKRCGLMGSDICDCGEPRTVSNTIDSYTNTKLIGGKFALHKADNISIDSLIVFNVFICC